MIDVNSAIGLNVLNFAQIVKTTGALIAIESSGHLMPYLRDNVINNGFWNRSALINHFFTLDNHDQTRSTTAKTTTSTSSLVANQTISTIFQYLLGNTLCPNLINLNLYDDILPTTYNNVTFKDIYYQLLGMYIQLY